MIPRATLRLQFHRGFTFADAAARVDWMADLGLSHVYASPIGTARPGSMHGYDVTDPTIVNPDLGGETGLRALAGALGKKGMGLVIDIVPNHMAADPANPWWRDVLRRGRASRFAAWFDIDWDTAGDGKVLLPVLGRPLDEAIAAGELSVDTGSADGPVLRYFSQCFPLADGSVEGRGSLANLLARQHYRLASWRVAGDRINWRRFFDINELVSLRMEEPAAFEAVHALPLRLFEEGTIGGLRVDHVDGLTDPAGYCRALRARLDAASHRGGRARAWLVVEKILLGDEALPTDWGVDGTTGYDFMNEVSALQHDAEGEPALARGWAAVSGRPASFEPEEEQARREIVARSFGAQLEACAAAWETATRHEVPRAALRRLLGEFLAYFPVYRTYAAGGVLPARDAEILRTVADDVRRTCLATDRWALDLLSTAMLEPPADGEDAAAGERQRAWQRAMTRLQQLSAPVAAKSVEDTGFYRYGRLLSRNDVGFDVAGFALSPEAFQARMAARRASWPHAMLTTATHDHKRGEDLRARLAVLSESAAAWTALLRDWIETARPLRAEIGGRLAPTAGDLAMLLQMIVGAWPPGLAADDSAGRSALAERLAGWQEKALREAKLCSDWAAIDPRYEAAARAVLMRLLVEAELPELLRSIASLVETIAPAGAVNGLAQCLLRLTVPGVPDLYQGCDLWDFSLVDPDNRRPVDFAVRALATGTTLSGLAQAWRDGRVKQHLLRQALALRRQAPPLFAAGDYTQLAVAGDAARSIVAFTRRHGPDWLMVLAPRLVARQLVPGGLALAPDAWKGTEIDLGAPPPALPLYDWLGGGLVELLHRRIKADFLCGTLPLALISTVPPPEPQDC